MLDLAAGTGKLTRALLSAGLDVIVVEPQAELRETLAASVGAERVLDGFAEAIPLPGDSVAAVTVADAFHRFDQTAGGPLDAADAWRRMAAGRIELASMLPCHHG